MTRKRTLHHLWMNGANWYTLPGIMRFDRWLEDIYEQYTRVEFIHPDPLEYVLRYGDPQNREVVGLLASSLAYGGVKQIGVSIQRVLDKLGASPVEALRGLDAQTTAELFADFRHRWTDGADLAGLLMGISGCLKEFGSLRECFEAGYNPGDEDLQGSLKSFFDQLKRAGGFEKNSLLSDPSRGSACKRYHMFLRWMVRKDAVDPGGWDAISPSKLLMPLDTHIYRISKELGFTSRASADLKTAREITAAFRKVRPEDPVKYDFALARTGINPAVSKDWKTHLENLPGIG